ncbi:MAG: RNA polymerase sigma factor [Ekhidna sp.]|nr:RNA polymerase sigma factor [Ekhidna sp.]MBC6409978.1 RNA polymerase sigma factor [Ekhidna sp.]MBC6426910.1 RNA polymerase sigma factor [Ekhidna sp.]
MTNLEFGYKIEGLTSNLKPYALKLTKDKDEADDLLQETVFKAYSNREKFQEGTNLKAWMYTIMKNTFITNYQRMVRRKTFIDTTDNNHFINTNINQLENRASGNFVLRDVNKAINNLKDMYRAPLMMYFRGFRYHEIAKKLEIPIGTVKNRIHIARKELKEVLSIYAN